jgi:hypothetical protein
MIFPQKGQGPTKLEMIKSLIRNTINQAEEKSAVFEKVWPVVEGLVSTVVTGFNALGIFSKK